MKSTVKKFFEAHFETKKFFAVLRIIVILFLFIFIINAYKITLSKYASNVDVFIKPTLAFFITEVGSSSDTINLGEILPSNNAYYYSFTVSNYKDTKRINVNLEYDIKFVTTTNLPLEFSIYKNTSDYSGSGIVTSDTITENTDGMYFRNLATNDTAKFGFLANETNTYVLKVNFPESYKYNSVAYEGVIDLVEVIIDARQIV